MKKILIVDDDTALCYSMERVLGGRYSVHSAHSTADALALLPEHSFHLAFLDLRLGEENGLDALQQIRAYAPELPVVMMTAFGTSETVMDSVRLGAEDFLVKPVKPEEIEASIEKYAVTKQIPQAVHVADQSGGTAVMVGISRPMRDVLRLVASVAETGAPVLISGESGTGKELVARLIHARSPRLEGSFVAINCAAIPSEMLEAELFGYTKGAFSGAVHDHAGMFERANHGTLLLDEIGEMPLELQAKLLRVLEDGQVAKLGSKSPVQVDVRIIAATNKKLAQLIHTGAFRADLFYRLNVMEIPLPPLRQRKDDIPALVGHFVAKYAKAYGKRVLGVDAETMTNLTEREWQGNVRQLENEIKRAIVMSTGEYLCLADFRSEPAAEEGSHFAYATLAQKYPDSLMDSAVGELEKYLINETLARTGGKLGRAAEILGISRVTLNAKLKKYLIEAGE